jgi:hypothetical protein
MSTCAEAPWLAIVPLLSRQDVSESARMDEARTGLPDGPAGRQHFLALTLSSGSTVGVLPRSCAGPRERFRLSRRSRSHRRRTRLQISNGRFQSRQILWRTSTIVAAAAILARHSRSPRLDPIEHRPFQGSLCRPIPAANGLDVPRLSQSGLLQRHPAQLELLEKLLRLSSQSSEFD